MNIVPVNNKETVSTLGFTSDQRKAYDGLIEFINEPYNANDYKRALVGPAGTGKTYLVRALIKNCNIAYSNIGLAAPTHKACRVLKESIGIGSIKVNTLQSDLGLRINFNIDNFDIKNPPFDPRGKIKIGDYSIYIVDEASMINVGLRILLERICKSHNCKIIYIGDSSQLPPVNERTSSAFTSIKTYTLNQIVRQDDDNPVKYLLDLLRYDITHKSSKFLEYISKNRECFDSNNIKGYKVCSPSEFNDIAYTNFNDEALTRNIDFVKVIAYTNDCVSSWNKFIRNAIIADADKSIITKNDLILSYITLVNQFNDCIIKNREEYILKDVVNYVHPTYEIKGFLVRFIAIHGGAVTTPIFIVDHTDMFSIQKYYSICNQLIQTAKSANSKSKAQCWREYYAFKETCLLLVDIKNTKGETIFSRDLDYGFALTSHCSQGSTFDTAFVDVNDIVFNKYGHPYTDIEQRNRRLYVACSRCRNKLYLKYGN